jgi:hypothetical protein
VSDWRSEVEAFKKSLKPEAPSISTQAIRFGFFGCVGGGKSVTAGIFAVSITPTGKIGWIDGEGHRSGWAVDVVADMAVKKYGGTKKSWTDRFAIIHIDPPFNPLRVVAAIEALEEADCKTIICDIMSQCWDSDGGYLDMKAEEVESMVSRETTEQAKDYKRQKVAAAAAAHVKPWTHGKLVNKVNTSKANLVLLFQAKQKFNVKTSKPDDFVTPIQESGLTRTALAVGRVEAQMIGNEPCGGFCTFRGAIAEGTKFTHPSILRLLPENGKQLTFEHGEALLKWCQDAGKPQAAGVAASEPEKAPASQPTTKSGNVGDGALAILQTKLWKTLTSVRTSKDKAEQGRQVDAWLVAKKITKPENQFMQLDLAALKDAIAKTEIVLEEESQGIVP